MFGNRTVEFCKRIPRAYYFFGIFSFLFVALLVFVEIKNGKFWTNDFKVYYLATQDFFSGGDPYINNYGLNSGFFKYPPTTLYFFGPLSHLDYFSAQVIHTLLLWVSLVSSICLLHFLFLNKNEKGENKKRTFFLYLLFIFIATHVVRELHLGNLNLVLLLLFSAGILSYHQERHLLMVVLWSFMIIIKPIVIIALIPFLLSGQIKPLLQMAGIGVLFFFIPFIHLGSGGVDLWSNWIKAIAFHGDYIISQNSLTYLAQYYLGINSPWWPSIIVLGIFLGAMMVERMKQKGQQLIIPWIVIFMALTPNFFVTDTEHFMMSLPLLVLLVFELLRGRKYWAWLIFGFLIIGFSLQSNDLWGKELSTFFNEIGLLGLSNLGLIIFFIVLRQFNRPEENSHAVE